MTTIMTTGAEQLVQPFIIKYYGTGKAHGIKQPLDSVTTRDRFGLVQSVKLDITLRMLQHHELAAAMGFPKDYIFFGTKMFFRIID